MNVNLSEDEARAIAADAFTKAMTPEKRDELIRAAIVNIITPKDNGRFSSTPNKSILQEAFERAVNDYAREWCKNWILNDPECKAQLEDVVRAGWVKALVTDRESTVNKIAVAMSESLWKNS